MKGEFMFVQKQLSNSCSRRMNSDRKASTDSSLSGCFIRLTCDTGQAMAMSEHVPSARKACSSHATSHIRNVGPLMARKHLRRQVIMDFAGC